jgi:hypothetical protein
VAVVVPSPANVRRLARHFLHHLGAHILERILQVDFLRDRDAVLGDRRRSEALAEDDVAPRGPSVTFTAFARLSTPRRIACRD